MCKHLGWKGLVLCAALASASPALAQQQTVNFSIGGFVPRGEDGRVTGDVLNENRTFLVFDSDEFNSVTAGGEWLFPIGNFVEGGAGVSFSNRSVPTVYDCCVDNFGDEIEQELRLRRIPNHRIGDDRSAPRDLAHGAGRREPLRVLCRITENRRRILEERDLAKVLDGTEAPDLWVPTVQPTELHRMRAGQPGHLIPDLVGLVFAD